VAPGDHIPDCFENALFYRHKGHAEILPDFAVIDLQQAANMSANKGARIFRLAVG